VAEIRDCIGKQVKINSGSITIKDEDGKTRGVVRDITSLYDLQCNKQTPYFNKLREAGGGVSTREVIIKDNQMYVFRNIKSKLFHEEYGYFDEEEKRRAEEQDAVYDRIKDAGIEEIDCMF
jgi:hypothetical protein